MGLLSKKKHSVADKTNKSWYADRYESISVQRNMLFFISLIALIATIIAVIFISKVTLSKTIEPLVVEVEDKSGFTNIVNPNEDEKWTTSKSINVFFLVEYLRARESYSVASYVQNYNTVVRLMSSAEVYNQFKNVLNNTDTNPVIKYGANNSTTIKIRSMQFLESTPEESSAQIRFSIIEEGNQKKQYNKIVSIVWSYIQMDLNFEDRTINPLGFQVKAYSISNDVGD
ncbi:MAG: type IV secretion system protein [Alphaproteobacteria bacterium]|nr:type IV secretion system protein [Alphaproteobacteria bacterium]